MRALKMMFQPFLEGGGLLIIFIIIYHLSLTMQDFHKLKDITWIGNKRSNGKFLIIRRCNISWLNRWLMLEMTMLQLPRAWYVSYYVESRHDTNRCFFTAHADLHFAPLFTSLVYTFLKSSKNRFWSSAYFEIHLFHKHWDTSRNSYNINESFSNFIISLYHHR